MDQTQKRQFIEDLLGNLKKAVLAKVAEMPESWDGFELRRYIADKAQGDYFIPMGRKRAKEYQQEVITRNL